MAATKYCCLGQLTCPNVKNVQSLAVEIQPLASIYYTAADSSSRKLSIMSSSARRFVYFVSTKRAPQTTVITIMVVASTV